MNIEQDEPTEWVEAISHCKGMADGVRDNTMTIQLKVILSEDDVAAIRAALSYKADAYEIFANGSAAPMDVRRAHWAEAVQARNLAVFLANAPQPVRV